VSSWSTEHVPDLSGRTAVVTGANSGLGREVAAELALHGAHVVLGCRNEQRGTRARTEMLGSAEVMLLDLADLASVRNFARTFSHAHRSLDLLVCNAGVMATPRRSTSDGFELQFGTNHLGHFALTGLVLPQLLTGMAARVVVVSSNVHRMGAHFGADLGSQRWYHKWVAYGRSKFANLLFMLELQRRATGAGTDLLAVGAHPGWAATNLQSTGPRMAGSALGERLAALGNRVLSQPAEVGALPILRAATDPEVRPADFFGPGGFARLHGLPERDELSPRARDEDRARELWEESERLTGVTYDWAIRR
jgi:NAD(P)-dependent dehydrogenase (short-subunit alcohol dehydrogenase family)